MKKLIMILIMLPIIVLGQNDGYLPKTTDNALYNSKIVSQELLRISSDSSYIIFNNTKYYKSDLFTLWEQYVKDCNELVPDTIKEYGTINCELLPVKINNKIVSYTTNPKDTIWKTSKCQDYKYDDYSGLILNPSGNLIWGSNITTTENTSYSIIGEANAGKMQYNTSRDKICMIKKRKPTWEHFWNTWLVENKIINIK